MNLPPLCRASRVMLFAPHPDDEALAAGVFLQRAVARGAAIRVVYATDGENNCWPQRFLEGRVRLRAADRRRWGARRRREAIEALRTLQISAANVEFLGLPDQGLTDLLLSGCGATVLRLAHTINQWEPTHLLVPSTADTHPDHSALAVLLRMACDDPRGPSPVPARLQYLIHGASKSFAAAARSLSQTAAERRLKRRAIICHSSQVALSRRRFLGYARRPERFIADNGDAGPEMKRMGPIRSFARDRRELSLQVNFTLKPLRERATSLYLIGHDSLGGLRTLRTTLPGSTRRLELIDAATGAIDRIGQYHGDAFDGTIILPLHGFTAARALYLKLDRRVWFFDEAGWLEVDAARPSAAARPRVMSELAVA